MQKQKQKLKKERKNNMIKYSDIIKLSSPDEEVDKRTVYRLTKSPDMTSIKDVEDGTILTLTHVCYFTDTNKDGEISDIMSMMDEDGTVYATQSETFKDYLDDIINIFEGEDVSIIKKSGKTKAGRDFVYCTLA